MSDTSLMFDLILDKHRNQTYGKEKYTYHLLGVMDLTSFLLKDHVLSPEEKNIVTCIALGHDLIEDTDVTYEYLKDKFGEKVATGIQVLTRPDDHKYTVEEGDLYLDLICMSDFLVYYVKLADSLFNLNESVKSLDIKRIKKYSSIVQYLVKNNKFK